MIQRWYAAAAFSRARRVVGEVEYSPMGTVHAKCLGTPVTACGLPSSSMTKFFDLEFPVAGSENCEKCSAVTSKESRRR
jgi:hypothetical protein